MRKHKDTTPPANLVPLRPSHVSVFLRWQTLRRSRLSLSMLVSRRSLSNDCASAVCRCLVLVRHFILGIARPVVDPCERAAAGLTRLLHHSLTSPILTTRPSGEAWVASYPRGSPGRYAGRLSSTFITPRRNEIPLDSDCGLTIKYDPCRSSVAQQPTRPGVVSKLSFSGGT